MAAEPRALTGGARRWARAVALVRSERPAVLLGFAMLGAFVLLYRKGNGLTLHAAEWGLALDRRDWTLSVFLEPEGGSLSVVRVVIFKLLFVTAGLDDYWAYRAVLLALHCVCAALVFVLARRRVGPYVALALALAVLFLGSAWQGLLLPYQVGYLAAVAAGLGMLLALEARRHVVAAVLLGVALASSALGVVFGAAALVELAWRRTEPRARVWFPLAPLALYGLWAVVYDGPLDGAVGLIRHNLPLAPGYVANAAASTFGAVTGLGVEWGRPLAVIAAVALAVRLSRAVPVSPRLAALLASAAAYWGFLALFRAHRIAPTDSRYVYFGAVLIVLVLAEVVAAPRVTARAGAVLAFVLAIAAVANYGALRDASRTLQDRSAYLAAELGALELAGRDVDPAFRPSEKWAPEITAGRYFAAVDRYGSPADSPEELASRSDPYRQAADRVLAKALGSAQEPPALGAAAAAPPAVEMAVGGSAASKGSCVSFSPTALAGVLELRSVGGAIVVTASGDTPVEARLRAFASTFPQGRSFLVRAGSAQRIPLPRLPGLPEWHLRIDANDRVTACSSR